MNGAQGATLDSGFSPDPSAILTQGKAAELRTELQAAKGPKNVGKKKTVLKKIVANMTMSNNEMIVLFEDIIDVIRASQDLDVKKMCFLYLITYCKAKPEVASAALDPLLDDVSSRESPLVRALALKTLSSIPLEDFIREAVEPTKRLLFDDDPYVRKTACLAVAKLWSHDPKLVEHADMIALLNRLLNDGNPTVVAAALAALMDITEKSADLQLTLDHNHASKIATVLGECSEWSQTSMLQALLCWTPQTSVEAERMVERVLPRLQHANAAVVLGTVRLIVYLANYSSNLLEHVPQIPAKLGSAMVNLASRQPELQYLALRNCILLLQSKPQLLQGLSVKAFFCKYNDPIYIKTTKLELIYLLANESNIGVVLRELREYATEIDVQVVRKSVRAIGKLALKLESASAAKACVDTLMYLVETRVSYIVQEAIVALKNILRRYPGRFEGVIGELCEHLDALDEPEAREAMAWIVGQYADRIDDSHIILDQFLASWHDEPVNVQLALLTATVKLFILRPTRGQAMVPKVLKWATEETDNPDLRDRGFMYWRLLSSDPAAARDIVHPEMPLIHVEDEAIMDPRVLEELELGIGTLASIYLKPVRQVFRLAKPKKLANSPCLIPRKDNEVDELKQLAEQAEKSKQTNVQAVPDIASLSIDPSVQGPGSLAQYTPLIPTPTSAMTPTTPSFPQMPHRANSLAVHAQSQQLLDDGSGSHGYFVTQNGIAQGNENSQNLLW